jgi:hypothetical protein
VDKTLFEKDAAAKEEDAEKKMTKGEKKLTDWLTADQFGEEREGVQKQIEEANRIERELKEKRKKDEKDEKHRLLLQRKEMAKERKRLKEEKKVALALAALEVPKSKGVRWDRRHSCWKVQLSTHGKKWHLGHFDFDDHTKAVAAYSRHKSMTKTELEALDKRR